jgi:diguanylate cyclase (GGDEF)-like protein|tara:strand:- start:2261 stop:3520 length:1260 start_codon:yes stop_codon:yes gene_type:complete
LLESFDRWARGARSARERLNPKTGDVEEQRNETYRPAGEHESIQLDSVKTFLDGFRLDDIIWSEHHSEDFKATRSEYVLVRLRFMLIFFSLAVLAWSVIDFYTLTRGHFYQMVGARISLACTLMVIWSASIRRQGHRYVAMLLALTMLSVTLFYTAATLILHSGTPEAPLVGYAVLPLMAIALMGLFPATLVYGVAVIAMIFVCYIGLEYWLGTLGSLQTLNFIWTLMMAAGVALWIESGQLLMLLRLYRESTRDPLTGLINRRVLMKQLLAEVAMQEESGRCFSLLMIDLDRFKRINDDYGHMIGDLVLKTSAQMMASELRSTDIIARFGGEEFIAMLPGQNSSEAIPVAERIRARLANTVIETPAGEEIKISASIGVTEYESGERIEHTLNRVDESLYKAKQSGRNQVIYQQVNSGN